MIKAIIVTILTGILVGLILLWIEYIYFIPVFLPTTEPTQQAPIDDCSCTPGKLFHDFLQDRNKGPEMVVIPEGQFKMGNLQGNGDDDELPVHGVSVNRFAMSRYEVTFAEYDKFAKATNREMPEDKRWGRGKRPVINVSWEEANAYAEWLSQQTGQEYRLPKEAEWEYAARGDTDTQYWWGNEIGYNMANCEGCGSRWDNKKTAIVGSFAPNPFKLYDTVGNVYEWTCSEYEEKYSGKEQRCLSKHNATAHRVVRGGSWYSGLKFVRAANRYRFLPDYRDYNIGFRLVREVPKK